MVHRTWSRITHRGPQSSPDLFGRRKGGQDGKEWVCLGGTLHYLLERAIPDEGNLDAIDDRCQMTLRLLLFLLPCLLAKLQ
jgi:hypothetical protein